MIWSALSSTQEREQKEKGEREMLERTLALEREAAERIEREEREMLEAERQLVEGSGSGGESGATGGEAGLSFFFFSSFVCWGVSFRGV